MIINNLTIRYYPQSIPIKILTTLGLIKIIDKINNNNK